MTNYFQSFDLKPGFAIDQAVLEARYEQLMVLCHPDKFAGAATFEQRAAAKRAAEKHLLTKARCHLDGEGIQDGIALTGTRAHIQRLTSAGRHQDAGILKSSITTLSLPI